MKVLVKEFKDLSPRELYEILKLRTAVFVVEQACIYQDMDGKDQKALHVLGQAGPLLVAYARIFGPGTYFKESSIGRVAVSPDVRRKGYGRSIMQHSIAVVQERFRTDTIMLSAQCYLKKFYNDLGFEEKGEEYLEDGIPHIHMLRK